MDVGAACAPRVDERVWRGCVPAQFHELVGVQRAIPVRVAASQPQHRGVLQRLPRQLLPGLVLEKRLQERPQLRRIQLLVAIRVELPRKTVLVTGSARRAGGSCPRRAEQAKALCGSHLHKDATRFLLPLSLAARRVLLGRLPGPAHPCLDLVGPRGKLQALRRYTNITATRRARSVAHPRVHAPHNTDDTFPDDPTEVPSKSSRVLTSSWIAARRACAWVRPTRPRCTACPGHTQRVIHSRIAATQRSRGHIDHMHGCIQSRKPPAVHTHLHAGRSCVPLLACDGWGSGWE
eukprot:COSAG01_NODE_356_length_18316_cov_24.401493_20_plen_292_part_00